MSNKIIEYKSEFLDEKYTYIKHKSGLSIYVFPKDRITSCAILATEYGSVDNCFYDNKEKKYIKVPEGIAHFLEHKMFDNEDGTNVDDAFSELGADPNAYTSWEETGYFFTCSDNFYQSLDLLIGFVMNPYFTESSIEKEQGIIGQEIAMDDDDPYSRCYMNMVAGLYERNPVRLNVVGSEESISKINAELLYKCHRTFYNPANMVLIVCGKVDLDKVLDTVDNNVSGIEGRSADSVIRKYPGERKRAFQSRVSCRMHIERPMFCIGFKDSNAPSDNISRRRRQIIAELVMGVIFSNSGELYSDLFKRGIMTTPFNYGEEYGKTYSFCYAGGECDDPELLMGEITSKIEKIRRHGLNAADFERRRKMTFASDIKIYDSTWDIANALFDNAFWSVDIFSDSKTVEEITLDEANSYVKEIFRKDKISFSVVYPHDN